jgi:hypothetical protein
LYIEAHAQGMLDLNCRPQRSGLAFFGNSGTRPNAAFTTIQHPSGRYTLEVRTAGLVEVEVLHEVD